MKIIITKLMMKTTVELATWIKKYALQARLQARSINQLRAFSHLKKMNMNQNELFCSLNFNQNYCFKFQ